MNFFNIIISILISIVGIIIITLIIKSKQMKQQNTIDKRVEIEAKYIREIKKLNSKKDKIAYIKKCNSELSRNIFFTKQESIKLITKLTSI